MFSQEWLRMFIGRGVTCASSHLETQWDAAALGVKLCACCKHLVSHTVLIHSLGKKTKRKRKKTKTLKENKVHLCCQYQLQFIRFFVFFLSEEWLECGTHVRPYQWCAMSDNEKNTKTKYLQSPPTARENKQNLRTQRLPHTVPPAARVRACIYACMCVCVS